MTARDLGEVRRLVQLSPEAEALLASRPRPIAPASALAKLPDVARAFHRGGQA